MQNPSETVQNPSEKAKQQPQYPQEVLEAYNSTDNKPGLIEQVMGMVPKVDAGNIGKEQKVGGMISQMLFGGNEKQQPTQQQEQIPEQEAEQTPMSQPTATYVDATTGANPAQDVDAIYNKYVGRGDALSETMYDLMASGRAQNQEEAQKMAMDAMNRAAGRLAQKATDDFVGKLGDTVENVDEAITNGWYTHDVQDNLKKMAAQLGIQNSVALDENGNYITNTDGYDQFINGMVKPAMVESLVKKYGENYRPIAEDIATRLYSHDEGVQNRMMNQDINNALAEVIGNYVSPAVVDEYNKAQEAGSKAFTEGMAGSQYIPASLRLGAAMGAQYEANQAKDPKKVLGTLQKKFGNLYKNPQFLTDIANAAFKVFQQYNMEGGLSGDPKDFKPMIDGVIKNELDQLEVQGMMPKGSAEYIMKTGLGNTIVGKIARKTMQTDYQNWLEDMANQQYQPGFWENVASGALTFAGDAWSYWLPGAAGGKLTKSMIAKAEGRLAGDLMAKGMERKMAERAAKVLIGKSKSTALKTGAVHGATTFGGQAAISKPMDEAYRSGQFDENGKIYKPTVGKVILNTLGEVAKQTAVGAIMQGGTVANMVGKGRGLATNILADIGGKAADSSIMTGQQLLEQMAHDPSFKPTGKDAAESFLESMANLTAIGLPGIMGKYARFKNAREFNRKYDFNDQDIAELKRFGYDNLRSTFEKMGIGEYRVVGENAQRMDNQLTQEYMNLMSDKSVPETLKAKMMAVVEGKRPSSFSPVVDSIIIQPMDNGGKVYLETLNKDGGIIDRKEYSSYDEAQKADEKLEFEKNLGLASVLEGEFHKEFTQDHINDLYNQAVQKYNMGEPLTDEEKTAVYLHQNASAINDIMRNQQSGMKLTEQELQLVDAYRHAYEGALENSTAMRDFVGTFEDSHGVARGTLRKALESKDKKYTPLVESYLKELYDSIMLKREMRQTVDDLYNTAQGRGQERIEQKGGSSVSTPYQDNTNSVPSPSDADSAANLANSSNVASNEPKVESNEPKVESNDVTDYAIGYNAYRNGDTDALKAIDRNDDVATMRLQRVFADSEKMLDLVLKSVAEGKDMEMFVQQRAGILTPVQQDAIRKYVKAYDAKMGALDAMKHADDGYGDALKEQLWPYQSEDGNIVPATLTDGSQVFLKKANEYGGGFVVVPDENGNPTIKQVSNKEIKEVGMPIAFDDFVTQTVEQQKAARQQQFNAQFDGSDLKPNDTVEVAMEEGDEPMELVFSGYSEDGKIVLSDGKSSIAISKKEFDGWRMNALKSSINAELDAEDAQREQDAAKQAEADKQERYKKGIFGYADGQPDYSSTETDPNVAAEYLQETSGENRKALFSNIAAEKQSLQTRIKQLREHIANNEEWLSINADLDPKNAETRSLANKQMEGQIVDLQNRFNNWNKIRAAVMTPEEATAIKNDRSKKIADAGVDESAIVPIEGYEVPVLTNEELKKQYPTMDEASDYITSERKKIYRIQSDEVQREIDGVNEELNRYTDGEIDLEPEELRDLNTTKANLQARMDNLTASAKELKAQADKLKSLYKQENMKERAETFANLSPAEQRRLKAEDAIEKGDLNTLGKLYEDTDVDFTDDTPNTVDEYVASNIGQYTLNYEGKDIDGTFHNGLQQEIGLSRKDLSKLRVLAAEGKGKTFDEFVNDLYNNLPDHLRNQGVNTQEIRNAFLGLLGSAEKYSDLKNYILKDKVARAEEQMKAFDREEEEQRAAYEAEKASLGEVDNQGNPINADGSLKLEPIKSVDDLTDDDFLRPSRNVELPAIPKNVDEAIGANGKPVIIKKNIFEKNLNHHAELSADESRVILRDALYNPTLVGQTQPVRKPSYKVAVRTGDKNSIVVLDVYDEKSQIEIVGWRRINAKGLEKMKRQAEREGGQFLILSPKDGSAAALSALPHGLSFDGKVTNNSANLQEKGKEISEKDEKFISQMEYEYEEDIHPSEEDKPKMQKFAERLLDFHQDKEEKPEYGYIVLSSNIQGDKLYPSEKKWFGTKKYRQGVSWVDKENVCVYELNPRFDARGYLTAVGVHKLVPLSEQESSEKVKTTEDSATGENLPFAQMNTEDLPFHRDVKEVKPSNMTEAQQVAYNAVSTMLKKAGIPVKVISNEDMEKVAEEQDNLAVSMLLSDPRLRFNIKTPEQKKAAKAAYDWATKHRPDKWNQYAIVNMDNPNQMPEYFQKKDLAEKWRKYYTNNWKVGNYKAFNLNKPFEEQIKDVKGRVPGEFDPYKVDAQRSKIDELEKQKQEAEDAYNSKNEERVKYNNQLMKEYMDEHGLSSENDIPDDVWNECRTKSFEKYQDQLDGLFEKYKDLDRQIKAVAEPGVRFLRTYHGTGASFDRFDLSHALEGEGSESFGHGVYVTNSGEIGKDYAERAKKTHTSSIFVNKMKPLNDTEKGLFKAFSEYYHEYYDFGRAKKDVLEDVDDSISYFSSLVDGYNKRGVSSEEDAKEKKRLEKLVEEYKAAKPRMESVKEEDLKNIKANRYDVEIPDDKGDYLDWNEKVPSWLNIDSLASKALELAKNTDTYRGASDDYMLNVGENIHSTLEHSTTGRALYNTLSHYVGDKNASKLLFDAGFVGIKYPAGSIYGGAKEGDTNYVIFNEDDAKIVGNTQFAKGKGVVYGYTDGKEIVLNQEHLNPNTPIHEYQHIWRTAAKEKNPGLIEHGDKLIMQTSLFADLKQDPNYNHLSDEQICDEAFARLTGEDGAAILEQMAKDAIKENPLDTAKELNIINRLKDWLKKFWYWTLDTFTKWKPEDIKKMTLEDIRNLVLRDLAQGVDPRKVQNEREEGKDSDFSVFADKHQVDVADVEAYAKAMQEGKTAAASRALANIRIQVRKNHRVNNPFANVAKYVKPVVSELKEKYGDVDAAIEELIKQREQERNMMEAARKRAEAEEAKRKKHLEELAMLSDEDIDKRYIDAIGKGDETTAREMLDESARRKGYGDVDSDYQGVGAWEAPSNPGYESDDARRADIENAPNVNLEDMAMGYNLQPDDYFTHPERYSQNTPHGLESIKAIKTALDALKRGEKDVKVKVYRAVPTSVKEGKLRNGDWVTPSKKYADIHGNSRLEGKYRIIEDEVPANQLWWDGNDANEFGFDDGKEYKYKNAKNNRKLNDLITRDDKGNIIPPSKRFNSRKADVRFMFAGEKGATEADKAEESTTRQDNLNIAKVMAEHAIKPKAIKYATGWERGADGKWRYEIPDAKSKDVVSQEKVDVANIGRYSPYKEPICKLSDILEDKDLFSYYPKLKNVEVVLCDGDGYLGMADHLHNNIALDRRAVSVETQYSEASNQKEIDAAKKAETEAYNRLSDEDKEHADDGIDAFGGYTEDELKEDNFFANLEKTNPQVANVIRLFNAIPQPQGKRFLGSKVSLTEAGSGVLLHEVQHFIQEKEGFARGGNVSQFSEPSELEKQYATFDELVMDKFGNNNAETVIGIIKGSTPEYQQFRNDFGKSWDRYFKDLKGMLGMTNGDEKLFKENYDYFVAEGKKKSAFEQYQSLAGEVEARNVQKRLWRTEEERRNSLASDTEDVDRGDQIVMYNGGPSFSVVKDPKTIEKLDKEETVKVYRAMILSRWDKPVRIVPDSEVADVIVNDMFKGKNITMPTNVLTPSLRKELEKRGVPFVETDNRGRIVGGKNDGVHYSKVYGKKANVKMSLSERIPFIREQRKINNDFNDALDKQIAGTLPKGYNYQLGKPSSALKFAGIDDLPIELSSRTLEVKSSKDYKSNHPFDLNSVKNLPIAIQRPVAIFDSEYEDGRKVILTELKDSKGHSIIAVLGLRKLRGRNYAEVNSIISLYGKDSAVRIANWFDSTNKKGLGLDEELCRWADTKKASEWLTNNASNVHSVGLSLKRIAKVIKSFENNQFPEENLLIKHNFGNILSGNKENVGFSATLGTKPTTNILGKGGRPASHGGENSLLPTPEASSGAPLSDGKGINFFSIEQEKTGENAANERKIADSVVNTANQLGGAKANVYTSMDDVPEKYRSEVEQGAKGWYDPESHTVHVYLPNCEDAGDAQRTVFHEKIGHEGMEVLLGGENGVRKFADFVYKSVDKETRGKILDFAKKYDPKWENPDRMNVGTQEYIAHLAENGPQTAEEFSLWTKMKHYLIKALKKLGIRVPGLLNDKDLRYYLMKAGKALHVWDNMPKEKQEAMMAQASNTEIKNALSEKAESEKKTKEVFV